MSHTLIELTNQINAHPTPLLFLDTCAILDLIRVPYRDGLPLDMIDATKRLLLKAISQPPQLWVVIADQVEKEWQDHERRVSDELKVEIDKCQDKLTRFSDVLQLLLSTTYPTHLTQFSLETHLANLSKEVLEVSLKISQDNELVTKAWQRVQDGLAPAAKGKEEMTDCVIIEHYLEVCQRLRNTGFSQPIIFVSSNVTDYGNPPKSIRPPLDTQFSNLGIKFVTRLNWAMSLI